MSENWVAFFLVCSFVLGAIISTLLDLFASHKEEMRYNRQREDSDRAWREYIKGKQLSAERRLDELYETYRKKYAAHLTELREAREAFLQCIEDEELRNKIVSYMEQIADKQTKEEEKNEG